MAPNTPSLKQTEASSPSTSSGSVMSSRRKALFGDCALVEIIHLHDCLRGALQALERDVAVLSGTVLGGERNQKVDELERKVAGRFKVIWSVFRAHSSAEDEFIWPTLQSKTQGQIKGSPKYTPGSPHPATVPTASGHVDTASPPHPDESKNSDGDGCEGIEQEQYEEDHADEERMFLMMDDLLTRLRKGLLEHRPTAPSNVTSDGNSQQSQSQPHGSGSAKSVGETMEELQALTQTLSQHLMAHLEKEENQCMPLVVKHLSRSEIHDLVGKIMGKRSSDIIAQIMSMAVQNLDDSDRREMVKYMKQAMAGTFFDRWLSMSGWMDDTNATQDDDNAKKRTAAQAPCSSTDANQDRPSSPTRKRSRSDVAALPVLPQTASATKEITSQAELEKLIRAVATNGNLTPQQKNTTIQGLRDSVWKSNQRMQKESAGGTAPGAGSVGAAAFSVTRAPARRVTPPSVYYKKNSEGKVEVVWNSDGPVGGLDGGDVPRFSATELAPTHHDGATGAVLGCPHYARACKLRHPVSGRLYTCRLCCEQEREMPSKDQDEPLDRYAVNEVMCMKCNALQPANDRCLNPSCESSGKPFAKYYCRICHLYDDRSRPIFHCPYCNTCRMGLGLGIDFRHCMRCNACVSIADSDHRCIPQKLQGSCPICHESLFQSTKPLRGLKCGHVMHLSCFNAYRRGQSYTCPLCMRCMEDMSDYFAMLDAAVRMQPMPLAYQHTLSNIYCQDCEKTGQCRYHFVGLKCSHCGSYNTREMGRLQG